ncbi:MAG: Fic family protein [Acidimicrobiia bacterium]|nr:Fic family protein [Acidimicrobiia bacterium]
MRTESIASSKVEGLQVDTRTLAKAEARAEAGRRAGRDVQEVLANVDAMELAIEKTSLVGRIGPEDIVAIHAALMESTQPHLAGRVRTVQNWIGGNDYNPCDADFVPPPPSEVGGLLKDLCEFGDTEELPPLVQAAIAHAQFETIHPFVDGNGRTGRALIHVILRRRGLAPDYVPPISVVLARDRNSYIDGLTQFRNDNMDGWIAKFAAATARSAILAEDYLAQISQLQQSWRDRVDAILDLRADAAAWAIIEVLPGHPVITVPVAVAATGRSKSAVNVAVDHLEQAGVLRPLSSGRRNRAWEADGLLDILADLEAADTPPRAVPP